MPKKNNIIFCEPFIQKILKCLLSDAEISNNFINITGKPGIGKSILIPQIINTVKWSGVDLMPKIINCDKRIIIKNKLQNLSNTTGFKLPENKSINFI